MTFAKREEQRKLDEQNVPFTHTWRSASSSPANSKDTRHLFGFGRVIYSPPHDIESLWWLILYLVFVYVNTTAVKLAIERDPTAGIKHPRDDEEFVDLLDVMFFKDPEARHGILTSRSYFADCAASLHESMHPVANELEKLRVELLRCYIAAEKDRDAYLNPAAWSGLYDIFIKAIHTITEILGKVVPSEEDAPLDAESPRKDVEEPANADDAAVEVDECSAGVHAAPIAVEDPASTDRKSVV